MPNDDQIYFIVEEPIVEEVITVEGERSGRNDTGGGWGNAPRTSRRDALIELERKQQRVGIKASVLKAQMQEMINVVNDIFDQDPQGLERQSNSGLKLEEITLSVQVNAKGELGILGTGGELGGAGGITMKFARPKS